MTDGVIQKTFDQFRLSHHRYIEVNELSELQEKLVREIKKEADLMLASYGKWNVILGMKEKLIGDNQ